MNINNLNNEQYYYILDIENIENAKIYTLQLLNEIMNLKNINENDLLRIQKYVNDFCVMSEKLENRDGIKTIEDYKNSLSTLIILNSKMHKIIMTYFFKKQNKKRVLKLSSLCQKIKTTLPFGKSRIEVFLDNHVTAVVLVILFSFVLIAFFMHSLFYDFNLWLCVIISSIFAVLVLFLCLTKRIESAFLVDQINRTIYKNTFVYKINKKVNKEDMELILKLIQTLK